MEQSAETIKVLLVDDEAELLESAGNLLSRRGHSVSTASNGVAALTILDDREIDVVVLDVKMPGLGGEEVFRRISARFPTLPVIMLTGHGSVTQAFEMSRDGVFDYLSKPCDMDELEQKIKQAAATGRARRVASRSNGDAADQPISVLLVDDECELLSSLRRVLERRGMRITTAESGEWALRLLEAVRIDVVVLDVKMPGIDGLETLRRIKRDFANREVILLTGRPHLQTAITGIRQGAMEYLTKPPDVDALCNLIRQAYRQRRKALAEQQQQRLRQVFEHRPE